jgi:hypothetical protein
MYAAVVCGVFSFRFYVGEVCLFSCLAIILKAIGSLPPNKLGVAILMQRPVS